MFMYYTGMERDKYDNLFEYIKQFLPDICRSKLPYIDQLLMVLMKLRLDVQLQNLADQFNISTSSAGSIFSKWIDLLYHKLSFLIHWPDQRCKSKKHYLMYLGNTFLGLQVL